MLKNKQRKQFSARAEIIAKRTYCRPKNEDGTELETWEEVVDRVIGHQRWLWERALTHKKFPNLKLKEVNELEGTQDWVKLNKQQREELEALRDILLNRRGVVAGRVLWLGGTEIAKRREASMFNCAHLVIETVQDVVDAYWLLLQGCGVGFTPKVGSLSGFRNYIPEIEVIRSTRTDKGGREYNVETFEDGVWTISVGDSAEAWAKSLGKLLAGKYNARKLVLDFSQIRPPGKRLAGYGWICTGDTGISKAYYKIAEILNRKAGCLLSKIDILDIMNWIGTVLSTRRSAEIALVEYGSEEWEEFADAKKNWWEIDPETGEMKNPQRCQSNNSLVFYKIPSREELDNLMTRIIENGGSEPGFINGMTARKRAPWFAGVNPCAEILLGNKGFCNLVELDVGKYRGKTREMLRDLRILARANYRQTIVDLRDGILQEAWHINNEFLRLCGVSLTGIVQNDLSPYEIRQARNAAVEGAYSMADELGLNRPANITTIKPSGTVSKIMDTTEGIHKPLGKYIFNWVRFAKDDPLVKVLQDANYKTIHDPTDENTVLVCFPVKYDNINFDVVHIEGRGKVEVNLESAIDQLERYKKYMIYWCDQNVSNTISYSPEEKDAIVDWLLKNWEYYVGVSFLFRNDPTKTAKDLGYLYLPQEVKTKEEYEEYVSQLKPVDIDRDTKEIHDLKEDDCAGGACPVK